MPKRSRAVHAIAIAALGIAVAGCNQPAAEPSELLEQPSEEGYTPAEQTAILTESIGLVYCDTPPQSDWCASFVELEVDDTGWANVLSSSSDPAMALSMCTAIAAVTYDDDAEPIGVHDVMIFGPGNDVLADCDVIPLDSGG